MDKKKTLLYITLIIILVLLIAIYSFVSKKQKTTQSAVQPTVYPTLPVQPPLNEQQQRQSQAESDVYTGKLQEQSLQQYPWQDKLPIQTLEYFIYFDGEEKKFIAKIYQSRTTRSLQIIKDEIVAVLQNNDLPVRTYPVEYVLK